MNSSHDNTDILDPSDWVAIPQNVVSTQVGVDTLIHDMITQQRYRLNDVGTRIWQLIDVGNVVTDVARVIGEEYRMAADISLERIRHDVIGLLSELHRLGLVRAEHRHPRVVQMATELVPES